MRKALLKRQGPIYNFGALFLDHFVLMIQLPEANGKCRPEKLMVPSPKSLNISIEVLTLET